MDNFSCLLYPNDKILNQDSKKNTESFFFNLRMGICAELRSDWECYVTEFAGRYNVRELDTTDQMALLAKEMVGKKLVEDS